jgi:hypothetical protein
VQLKLDLWKVPYNNEKGEPRVAIKVKPVIKVLFEFKWNRSILQDSYANLFLSKFDQKLKKVKLVETFWPHVRIYSFKPSEYDPKTQSYPRM